MELLPETLDEHWQSRYGAMIASPEMAVQRIKPGQRVFLGSGAGVPQALVRALCNDSGRLADIEIVILFVAGEAPFAAKALQEIFTVNTFFITENVRPLVQAGLADYTPMRFSDIPRLFSNGQLPLDVALIQITPPDQEGMVSLGVAVDVVCSAVENATLVLAQVNPWMPRTHGDALLSVWDCDLLSPVAEPLPEVPPVKMDATLEQIGRNIASLVPHGATLQLGMSRAAQSAIPFLADKKDLGIHSEMISDAVVDFLASGAVTGQKKSLDTGLVVTSFALGSRRLYQAIHNNPLFSFRRTEYVHDVRHIAHQQRMIAINGALQVDLTGQVCADSLGSQFYSGLGGLGDFNAGAAAAPEGRAIIALPATTRQGKRSRIVARLTQGAGVSLSRGAVHFVVSEYGVAYLFGKSIQERALALIGIAHPDFRGRLLKQALKLGYVRPELSDVPGEVWVGGREWRTFLQLADGPAVTFRTSRPTDWKAVKKMLYSLSQGTIYRRFMSHVKRFPFSRVKNFVFIDQRQDVAMVGTVNNGQGEEVIAIGGYNVDSGTNRAEVAFLVRDAWQGRGIGRFLMGQLALAAKNAGLSGLTAETLLDNHPMQSILEKCGYPVRTTRDGDTVHTEIDL